MVRKISSDFDSRHTNDCFSCDCLSMLVSAIVQLVTGIFSCLSCGGGTSAKTSQQSSDLSNRVSSASKPADQYKKNANSLKIQSKPFSSQSNSQSLLGQTPQLQSGNGRLEEIQRKKEENELENSRFSQRCDSLVEKFGSIKVAYNQWKENAEQMESRLINEFPRKEKWLVMKPRPFSTVEISFNAQLSVAKKILSIANCNGGGVSKDTQKAHLKLISHSIDFLKQIIPMLLDNARKNIDSCELSKEQKNAYFIAYSTGVIRVFELAQEFLLACNAQERIEEFKDITEKCQKMIAAN